MRGTINTNLKINKTMHISVKDYMYSKDPKNPDYFKVVNVTLFPDRSYEFDDERNYQELNELFEISVKLFEFHPDGFNEESLSFDFGSNINTGLEVPEYACCYDKDELKSTMSHRVR